ncbi:SDR family NAD(P)-dependent oxidoreductase [Gordonia sp. JH63]|uniref:oxidoreductase n=1 Tax=unclassified Gordonia (in: high G+C Gram-positive bacteria) TaxID=2657482 RepID=UPI00080E8097|nr:MULTISPECIES: oxidoreductase [unclassified Gordonia (in: high G+C Gram-positive bacteria)]MCT1355869.1 oxidoreductase [Gordonia sp. p3-SID1431]OCH79083.1 short-chain dehydrogenase [Gordonia sp. UCD-TK1]OCW86440.1 short-chain dehydrogenase [Nocardia farcinica]QHD87482.1 SDR family NAD(P)-dependent oxidoreductase [Gordonia sp. JH63]
MKSGWTLADAPPQTGRVAVVTGANSGIGREIALGLATLGARVVLACRNPQTSAEARDDIVGKVPGAELELVDLDLASLNSVHDAAAEIRRRHPRLDLLVNNAGVMRARRELTPDGFEMDFGTNYLGHYALTGLLTDRLLAADSARVVTVGSHVHRAGSIDFADLPMDRSFSTAAAYSRAKLAQMLFAMELDRRMRSAEVSAISLAAHPGGTRTGVMREQSRFLQWAYHAPSLRWLTDRFIMDPPDGALPVLRAATDPKAQGGDYYGPVGSLGLVGPPVLVEPSVKAKDRDVAARLWDIGAELTGVTIDLG